MEINTHYVNSTKIAELMSDDLIINSIEDGTDILGNLYYKETDRIIIHKKNITPDFFDLKNGIAGEILQKFSNYRVRLAIVGDFANYANKSVNDFIYESNKGNQVNFVGTVAEGLKFLSRK